MVLLSKFTVNNTSFLSEGYMILVEGNISRVLNSNWTIIVHL